MKQKTRYIFLVAALLVLNACSENENGPNEEYSFGDYTGSLSKAKIYLGEGDLTLEGNNDDFTYRTYFITDGDFEEGGDPWNSNDYTGATYWLAMELYVPSPSSFEADDYPSWRINYQAPAGEPFSYFEAWLGSNQENEFFQSVPNDTAVLTASGNLESDETLTLELSGQLGFYQNLEGGGWSHTAMKDTKMFVTGKVIDIRTL